MDDCEGVIRRIYDFLDGELTPEIRKAVQEHLERCGPCLKAFGFEAELKRVISQCCHEEVPKDLMRRLADALEQEESKHSSPSG